MTTMGTENPNRANAPLRPASVPFGAPQNTMPFLSSGPVVGLEASAFRPTIPITSQSTMPFSSPGPGMGSETSGLRPTPPFITCDPLMPAAPSSHAPPTAGPFQHLATTLSSTQVLIPQASPLGQPYSSAPSKPLARQISSQPVSLYPQSQISSIPLHPPSQTINNVTSAFNGPPPFSETSFSVPRPNLQPSSLPSESLYPAPRSNLLSAFPGYPSKQSKAVTQAPPVQSAAFLTNQVSYAPAPPPASIPPIGYQGGFIPPPIAPAGLYSSDHMQHQGSRPPTGSMQGLIEDFNSISLGSVPGSFDSGLDPKSLPRPLEGDSEPNLLPEMYSMNCSSRYVRLTTNVIPSSQSLVSRWHLPLGAVVCPLAETPDGEDVPVVNFATTGIIRCRRCRTYVNPHVTFVDAGRKWRCNICSLLNDVPADYFAPLDAGGRRVDLDQRPELTKGSVEFIAPSEYMVRPPMPPLYFFLIDVSISAIKSGMLEVVAQTIKSCLDGLPGFPRTQIGFITFDSTIHFYNMKSSLTQPQMMVVSDLDDLFVPLPDDLLVNLSESRTVVDTFLDSLPSTFQDNVNVESAFGPAVNAAFMVMSQLGGKLLIFQNTLPSLGVGRLKLHDDVRAYGTDKENALRTPEDPFYKQMAADFTKYQIAVNLYAFSDKYTDIASLGTLAKYTGGQVYYYPSFHSAIHKEKLKHELSRDLTRETAWEAVMRIRCGKGVKFTSYHGNFMMRSSDLLALPAVDCDKAYAAQLCLEEAILNSHTMYMQVALLYTSSSGERRIRVHTAAAPVVADLGEMYRHADTGAIVSLLSRLAIEKTQSCNPEAARNTVQTRIVKAFKEYRNLYSAQHHLAGKMIYPNSLKYLPLYALALCKSIPLRGGYADAQPDERCAAGYTMMALTVKKLLKLLYPNLIQIDEHLVKSSPNVDEFSNNWKRLPLALDSLDSGGLYLYDDGFRFVIWFGKMLSPDLVENLLGEGLSTDCSKVCLPEHDNEISRKLIGILKKLRESDPSYYQPCYVVRQGEQPKEGFLLLENLVEDQVGGTNGYVDWILQIQRQVQ